jgi:hypothetical protein
MNNMVTSYNPSIEVAYVHKGGVIRYRPNGLLLNNVEGLHGKIMKIILACSHCCC